MPIAITDEQLAIQASIREWAKRTRTVEVVRALEPADALGNSGGNGFPAGLGRRDSAAAEGWSSLAELGVFAIGLPAACGGAGSTAELSAALAQITESLVPGPVMPTLLAGLVLAECQAARSQSALTALGAGELSAAVALDAGSVRASRGDDGTLVLTGTTGPVLGPAARRTCSSARPAQAQRPSGCCCLPITQA